MVFLLCLFIKFHRCIFKPRMLKLFPGLGVMFMICEYDNNFRIDYSEDLHIYKGDGIYLNVKKDQIPANIKGSLDSAVKHNSCHELKAISRVFTNKLNQAWDT